MKRIGTATVAASNSAKDLSAGYDKEAASTKICDWILNSGSCFQKREGTTGTNR
jgi:hypothetical protein